MESFHSNYTQNWHHKQLNLWFIDIFLNIVLEADFPSLPNNTTVEPKSFSAFLPLVNNFVYFIHSYTDIQEDNPQTFACLADQFRTFHPCLHESITFLSIKSHDPLIAWFCNVAGQIQTIISPLPIRLQPPYLTDLLIRVPLHNVTRSFDHVVLQGHLRN